VAASAIADFLMGLPELDEGRTVVGPTQ
jgi:hypothetical protein